MKRTSTVGFLVSILALFVSGHLSAEEQLQLKITEVMNERNTKDLFDPLKNLVPRLTVAKKEKQRDYRFFLTGGLSIFREDLQTTVGDGAMPRIALGVQYNDWFGLELYSESAPALSPMSLLEDLEQRLNQTATSFSVSTTTNRYLGLSSKFSFEVNKGFSLVGKVGLARFDAHETSAKLKWKNEADQSVFTYQKFEGGVKGYSPVVSLGYETPFPNHKKASLEVFLTQMFDDKVKNLSLSTMLKYSF
ncbi:MAG: hypothetical protein F4W92_09230 [Gammaproteobacteria bacterium]|nr:hypothetical protein [Gammaproteobacteria bacterium]